MREIIDEGDFSDKNVCLRAIALGANRKRMTELPEVLTDEQIFEVLTKTALGTLRLFDIPDASDKPKVGHGTSYCSVERCHFSTEVVGVEMPGEVGYVFHFPAANELDHQTLPCKLHGYNSAKTN